MDGKDYSGTLVGINPETLSLCLADAKDKKGIVLHRVFLNGSVVAQIFAVEKPFDLKALSERFDKVFPTMVRSIDCVVADIATKAIKQTDTDTVM